MGLMGVIAVVLYLFPPEASSFYPFCMFHRMTGLNCPACGGLRAMHHALHGRFQEAFSLNPLLLSLAPVFAWIAVVQLVRFVTGREWPNPFKRSAWVWALFLVAMIFGIVRNLPFAH
jgi:hypothetical protein